MYENKNQSYNDFSDLLSDVENTNVIFVSLKNISRYKNHFDFWQCKYHYTKQLKDFLENNKKFWIIYLSPYSLYLDSIEKTWWFMKKSMKYNGYIKKDATVKEHKAI